MGLSQRDVDDFSLESKLRDLEAVVAATGEEKVSLFAASEGGAAAAVYAAKYPEKVHRMVLWDSFARPYAIAHDPSVARAALALVKVGWGSDLPAFRQFFTSFFLPDGDTKSIQEFTEAGRVSASPDVAEAFLLAVGRINVLDSLEKVQAPTLVIHRRGDLVVPFEAGQELAMHIPGARLLPLDGRNHILLRDEPELKRTFDATRDFLKEGLESEAKSPGGFVTIVFTDIERNTEILRRLGDAAWRDLLREHEQITRGLLKQHGGAEIKTIGDAFMASFRSATAALGCAVDLQRAFAARNESAAEPILVRVGVNAGEPIAEDGDLFGTAVTMASRIAASAAGGEIVASNVVRELVAGKGFIFADRGDFVARGFEDPVRLYELRWRD
jgi:class 3 adenylate cyclase